MKSFLAKLTTAALSLATLLLTGSTWAATPVAVWDGLEGLSTTLDSIEGNHTLTKMGGSVSEGVFTVGSDGGLKIMPKSGNFGRQATVIMDVEDVPSSANRQSIVDLWIGTGNDVILDTENGNFQFYWNNTTYGTAGVAPTGKKRVAITYNGSGKVGESVYVDGVLVTSGGAYSSNTDIPEIDIGARHNSSQFATGLKISRIAIFSTPLSQADIQSYRWPSETVVYTCTLDGSSASWDKELPETLKDNDYLVYTGSGVAELSRSIPGKITIQSGCELKTVASNIAGSVEIDDGAFLTLTAGTLDRSKLTNNGIINISGGTRESPITINDNGGIGKVHIEANSAFKNAATGGNKIYKVTGEGASSIFIMGSGQDWGMNDGTTIRDCTVVIVEKEFWIEKAAFFDKTVDIVSEKVLHIGHQNTPNQSFEFGSLNSNLNIGNNDNTYSVTLNMDRGPSTFSGSFNRPLTVNGNYPLTLSAGYTGILTIAEGASVKYDPGEGNTINLPTLGADSMGTVVVTSGTVNFGTNRPGANVADGAKIKMIGRPEEIIAGKIQLTVPADSTWNADKIQVVGSDGVTEMVVSEISKSETTLTLRLQTIEPITAATSISSLGLASDARGELLIKGAETTEGAYVVTFDADLPENVSVTVLGCVNFEFGGVVTALPLNKMTFKGGATVSVPSLANATIPGGVTMTVGTLSGTISNNGTLKITGDSSFTLTNSGTATIDVLSGKTTIGGNDANKAVSGNIYIRGGAELEMTASDTINYDGTANVYVYGTLTLGNKRQSMNSNNKLFVYNGGRVTGVGDGNGALDYYSNGNRLVVSGICEISANIRVRTAGHTLNIAQTRSSWATISGAIIGNGSVTHTYATTSEGNSSNNAGNSNFKMSGANTFAGNLTHADSCGTLVLLPGVAFSSTTAITSNSGTGLSLGENGKTGEMFIPNNITHSGNAMGIYADVTLSGTVSSSANGYSIMAGGKLHWEGTFNENKAVANAGTLVIPAGKTFVNAISGNGKIDGAGIFRPNVTTVPTCSVETTWTGVVELPAYNFTAKTGMYIYHLVNDNSKLVLNGLTGTDIYFSKTDKVPGTVELANGSEFRLNNGGSNATYAFTTMTGTGTFKTDMTGPSGVKISIDTLASKTITLSNSSKSTITIKNLEVENVWGEPVIPINNCSTVTISAVNGVADVTTMQTSDGVYIVAAMNGSDKYKTVQDAIDAAGGSVDDIVVCNNAPIPAGYCTVIEGGIVKLRKTAASFNGNGYATLAEAIAAANASEEGGTITVYANSGNLTVEIADGKTITVACAQGVYVGGDSITKTGAGTLVLDGASASVELEINVNEGELIVGDNFRTLEKYFLGGDIVVAPGAAIEFRNNNNIEGFVANFIGTEDGFGTVRKSGTGTITMTSDVFAGFGGDIEFVAGGIISSAKMSINKSLKIAGEAMVGITPSEAMTERLTFAEGATLDISERTIVDPFFTGIIELPASVKYVFPTGEQPESGFNIAIGALAIDDNVINSAIVSINGVENLAMLTYSADEQTGNCFVKYSNAMPIIRIVESMTSAEVNTKIDEMGMTAFATVYFDDGAVLEMTDELSLQLAMVCAGNASLSGNGTVNAGTIAFVGSTKALDIGENVTFIPASPANMAAASSITGAGTIVYDGVLPGTEKSSYQNTANWTGTVWLKNKQYTSFDFGALGHSGSKVKLTHIWGYSPNNTTSGANPEIVLVDEGSNVALEINDGYGGSKYFFRKLSGDGTFKTSGRQNTNSQYRFNDVSEFEGTFALNGNNKRVVIGTGSTDAGTGQILIDNTATVTIPAGKTWSANSGIKVDGTIGGTGTLGSNTTFGNGATIDASAGPLAMAENKTVTFGATLKVVGGELGTVLVSGVTIEPATLPGLVDATSGNAILDIAVGYDAKNQQLKIVEAGAQVNGKSYDSVEDAIKGEGGTAENPTAITITKDTTVAVEKMTAGNVFTITSKGGANSKFRWTDAKSEGTTTKYIVSSNAGVFTVMSGEPANGRDSYESYALNLNANDKTDKPYIKAAAEQTESGKITFNFFHGTAGEEISPRTGIAVTYKVVSANNAAFTGTTTESAAAVDGAVTVELPQPDAGESAVRYFKPVFSFE